MKTDGAHFGRAVCNGSGSGVSTASNGETGCCLAALFFDFLTFVSRVFVFLLPRLELDGDAARTLASGRGLADSVHGAHCIDNKACIICERC